MSEPVPTFDLHVVIDWSAASRPVRGRDSIWAVASAVTERGQRAGSQRVVLNEPVNLSTRDEAEQWLGELAAAQVRTLVGIDVPLGVPPGLVDQVDPLASDDSMSTEMRSRRQRWWDLVGQLLDDAADNANNRWSVGAELNRRIGASTGPFWGHPPGVVVPGLTPTKAPMDTVAEWRLVEHRLRDQGFRPFSVYQLAYAGSVGSQGLTAIARLGSLCETAEATGCAVAVWPFDPVPRASCSLVLAEVWPSAFDVDLTVHPIRDAAQVLSTVMRTVRVDRSGALDHWMTRGWATATDGSTLSDEIITAVCDEQGWILGIGADGRVCSEFI